MCLAVFGTSGVNCTLVSDDNCSPLISEDGTGKDSKVVVKFDGDDDQILHVQTKQKLMPFTLDHIFNMSSTQNDVFEACKDLIMSVTDGYNVCIFAYGQVSSSTMGCWVGSRLKQLELVSSLFLLLHGYLYVLLDRLRKDLHHGWYR